MDNYNDIENNNNKDYSYENDNNNDIELKDSPFFGKSLGSNISKKIKKKKNQYKKKNKNEIMGLEYKARNPQPNYSEFGKEPQFVDSIGREYKIAENSIFRNEILKSSNKSPDDIPERNNISLDDENEWGTQLLWIRIPIWQRGNFGFPNSQGEQLSFYDPKTQVTATGITDGVFYNGRSATGYLILRNFTTLGQTKDPKQFEYLVDKKARVQLQRKWF